MPNGKEFVLMEIKNTEPKNGGSGTKSAVESPISSVSDNIISLFPFYVKFCPKTMLLICDNVTP